MPYRLRGLLRSPKTRRFQLKLKGKVHRFGADVNTDVIIPARYLSLSEPGELARHCMEDIDAEFITKVEPGDIILAATNFGCGSSREHAPLAIKASGISCVIAQSFARIFFRNAINIGLPLLSALKRQMKPMLAIFWKSTCPAVKLTIFPGARSSLPNRILNS